MPYRTKWGGAHPGCLILLIDQSGSMADPFGGTQIGGGKRKCDMVATVVNNVLNEFIDASQKKDPVSGTIVFSDRADFALVGYGGAGFRSALPPKLAGKDFVTVTELQQNPLRVDMRTKKAMDETGSVYDELIPFLVWVDPTAADGTPMCAAFKRTADLAGQWARAHPKNFPPVVVHVTDGESTDGDPTSAAGSLLPVSTDDGGLLLFNCHITDKPMTPVEFPSSESQIPSDAFAKLLFGLSSEIPTETRDTFQSATGQVLDVGTRGYVFNGDANSVKKLLTFGSTVAAEAATGTPSGGPATGR